MILCWKCSRKLYQVFVVELFGAIAFYQQRGAVYRWNHWKQPRPHCRKIMLPSMRPGKLGSNQAASYQAIKNVAMLLFSIILTKPFVDYLLI